MLNNHSLLKLEDGDVLQTEAALPETMQSEMSMNGSKRHGRENVAMNK